MAVVSDTAAIVLDAVVAYVMMVMIVTIAACKAKV